MFGKSLVRERERERRASEQSAMSFSDVVGTPGGECMEDLIYFSGV